MTFKNWSLLCEFLNWDPTRGNTKKKYTKLLNDMCLSHVDGQKIVIDEVYAFPKVHKDGRCDKNDFADESLVTMFYYEKENPLIQISSSKFAKIVGLIPKNTEIYEYNIRKFNAIEELIDMDILNSQNTTTQKENGDLLNPDKFPKEYSVLKDRFQERVSSECKRIFDSVIKNLIKRNLINTSEWYLMVRKEDSKKPQIADENDLKIYDEIIQLKKIFYTKNNYVSDEEREEYFGATEAALNQLPKSEINERWRVEEKKLYHERGIENFYFVIDIELITVTCEDVIWGILEKVNLTGCTYDEVIISHYRHDLNNKFLKTIEKRSSNIIKSLRNKKERIGLSKAYTKIQMEFFESRINGLRYYIDLNQHDESQNKY